MSDEIEMDIEFPHGLSPMWNPPGVSYCCHRCFTETGGQWLDRMILCACGCKRCPKASDHRHQCTGSNEPGQIGSVYGVWEQ